MPENLTLDHFTPHVGTEFTIQVPEDGGVVTLELGAAEALEPSGIGRDDPFSLIFLGTTEHALDQRIYAFKHDGLGTLEIFIVPIGPDHKTGKLQYQAIFS